MAASVRTRPAAARGGGVAAAARPALMAAAGAAGAGLAVLIVALLPEAQRLSAGGRAGVVIVLALGLAFVGIGLYAWLRRPESPIGALLTAFGLVALASELLIAEASGLYLVSLFADAVTLPIFLHLLLAFPSGRLERGWPRRLVLSGYALTATVGMGQTPFGGERGEFGCAGCPGNLILIERRPGVVDALAFLETLTGVLLIGAAIVLMLRRWQRSTAFGRRALGPPVAVATLILVLAVISSLVQDAAVASAVKRASYLAFLGGFAALPLSFLVGLVRVSYFRTTTLRRLIDRLATHPGASGLDEALGTALADPSLSVAYWLPERRAYVDADGRPVTLPGEGADRTATEVRHGSRRVGAVVHARALRAEPELIQAVTGAAALALENGRLEAELRAQVEALRASRSRIVEAGDAERRRLGRDLHDGAQQRLVSLLLQLQLAREGWGRSPEQDRALVDEAFGEALAAVEELRELAAGIHPAVLAQRGLDAGLEALATRASVPVELDVELPGRYPSAIESAAYFTVAEALTNVAKYARATHAQVTAREDGEGLVVEVRDDGAGGADPGRGTGLRGLEDRVGAVGGTLEVVSPSGHGTLLRARLPLGGGPGSAA